MGILEAVLGNVWKKEATDWTYGRMDPAHIEAPEYAVPARPLQAGKEYLNVELKAMRITHVQRAASKYFGAVHSFLTLEHPLRDDIAFHVFTAPSQLKSLDAANLDRVIQSNQRLAGPTPYHGGDVNLEMALFSVKSADLSTPFVSILDAMSTTAGTAFLGAAAPLLPLLKAGVTSLTEAPDTVHLEIGISQQLANPSTGCYVVARTPAVAAGLTRFRISTEGALLHQDRRPVKEFPYLVFTISGTNNRRDWARLPDVREPYADLLAAARKGDQQEAASLFEQMKRRLRLSFDLVPGDAEEIIRWVEDQLRRAFPGSVQARLDEARDAMEPLESLPLYSR
jgi:hypothetical protein